MSRYLTNEEIEYIKCNAHKTIPELMKEMGRGRSAIRRWVKRVETPEQLSIRRSSGVSNGGLSRSVKIQSDGRKFAEDLFDLNKNNLEFHIGLALYWGEGGKRDHFIFNNTDEVMIKFMYYWIKKYLPNRRIIAQLKIPTNVNPADCINHWKSIFGEDVEFVKPSISKNTKYSYGVCALEVRQIVGSNSFVKKLMELTARYVESLIRDVSISGDAVGS